VLVSRAARSTGRHTKPRMAPEVTQVFGTHRMRRCRPQEMRMILRSSVVPPPSLTRELRWKGGRPRSRRGDRGRRTVTITIADPDPGPYPDAWRRRHHHGGQGEPVTVCRTPGRQAASGMVRRLPPSSDRLTWSHLWCAWLDGQLLQRVLTPLGRSQERRRIAAVGGAYTLPASRIT